MLDEATMKLMFTIAGVIMSLETLGQTEKDTVFIKSNAARYDTTITYKTDTVLFDSPMARHILVGTTVLSASPKNQGVRNFGYNLFNVESSDCQSELQGRPVEGSDRVVSVIRTDTLWIADLNITANCCYSFLGEIEIVADTTMNIIYHGYGSYCSCECCFGLKYSLYREKFVDPSDVKYFMVNGDRRTLRMID